MGDVQMSASGHLRLFEQQPEFAQDPTFAIDEAAQPRISAKRRIDPSAPSPRSGRRSATGEHRMSVALIAATLLPRMVDSNSHSAYLVLAIPTKSTAHNGRLAVTVDITDSFWWHLGWACLHYLPQRRIVVTSNGGAGSFWHCRRIASVSRSRDARSPKGRGPQIGPRPAKIGGNVMRKAAVIIGVDKTGTLTPLSSAAEGAKRVAAWLETEGFKVKCLTDKDGPVERSQVEKAIEAFVTVPPRYHLLLVYFSGHGYWQARADIWLLSGAPVKVSEAINLEAAMDLAKYSGIPNVVFVSDACRSIPNSRSGANVEGGGVFPNYDEITTASKIDYFKATSEALPAYEGPINGELQSILTAALKSAYEEPDADMVREIVEGGATIHVVPNRRLEGYLQKKVDAILAGINPPVTQRIEVNVPSSEDIYLARVRRPHAGAAPPPLLPPSAPIPPQPPPARDPGHEAAAAIARTLVSRPFGGIGGPDLTLTVDDVATEQKLQRRLPDRSLDHFETQMGFVVHGALVQDTTGSPRQPGLAEILNPGDGQSSSGIIRVNAQHPLSVAVRLADGRCVILAGLPGYIGHVTFDEGGMSNVSYVPSSNHWRWGEYNQRREEIDRLRAMVALAVDRNTFRVRSNREANALADRIRMYKGVDPTLGLYAAYAFSQASNDDQVVSVIRYMRGDLNADLFDTRLLASRDPIAKDPNIPVVPFCPMLTQSWHLLRARHVKLHEALREASAYLCGSLWATFEPDGAKLIIDAINEGVLK